MPNTGDCYTIKLKKAHLNWGTYRRRMTRARIRGEGYVPIPKQYAEAFGIRRGKRFTAVFADGFPSFTARAAGNSSKGSILPKQFQGDGDLKAFGRWFTHGGAREGDTVQATFTAPDTVQFRLIK